jgi:TolB-like protein/Tfp pilus assembly protein PilF
MSADSPGPPDRPVSQDPRLDSWKEIAAYLNRHVTTVRRWEKQEALPVHRHVHDKLGSVYAFREELDAWWRTRRLHLEQQHNGETIADHLDEPPPDATTTPLRENGVEWRAAVRVDPESYARSGASRNLQRRFGIVGGVLLLALAGSSVGIKLWQSRPTTAQATLPRSLAVLPFKPLLAKGGDELLQAAMTEAVINKLSQIPSISVEPFARVRRYGDLDQDPLAAGRALGVDAILEGYFHHMENRVRVRVRLLRTSNGRALATDEWDDAFTDILQVQSRVAESVAAALELVLNPAQMAGVRQQDTVNLEAYQHYLFGRYHLDVREFQRMVQAERAFREAIRLDPGYARAHSALALALLGETWLGGRRGIDVFPLAKEATQRALAIDESMALAHSALGEIYAVFESNPLAAQREHVRAIHLDDNDPWVIRSYGFFLLAVNAFDDALELNRRDLELEPTSPLANRVRAQMLYVARRYDECVAQSRKTLSLDSRNPTAYTFLARCFEQQGKHREAVEAYEQQRALARNVTADDTLVRLFAERGWQAYWRERLRLERRPQAAGNLAAMHVRAGSLDEAIRVLERGYAERDPTVFSTSNHPQWDPIRSDARFQALCRRAGLTEETNAKLVVSRPSLRALN